MSTKGKVYMLLSSGDMDGIDKVSSSLRTTLAKSTKDNINTSVLLSSGAMKQNNEAERSVPDDFFTQNPNKSVVALQSTMDGNCLYSSASLILAGNNSIVEELRALVSIELYLNSSFYAEHPLFSSLLKDYSDLFFSVESVLKFSVSHVSIDSNLRSSSLVKQEARHVSSENVWSSFICVLALASVLERNIQVLYPDYGEEKFKVLFNNIIIPRLPVKTIFPSLILLHYREGNIGNISKPNHYVPLVLLPSKQKNYKRTALFQSRIPFFLASEAKAKSSKISEKLDSNVIDMKPPTVLSSASNNESLNMVACTSLSGPAASSQDPSNPTEKLPFSVTVADVCSSHVANNEVTTKKNFSFPLKHFKTDENKDSDSRYSSFQKNPFPDGYINGIGKYDVGTYNFKACQLSEQEILYHSENVIVPDIKFAFPKNEKGRKFLYRWFSKYHWLAYSTQLNSAFCVQCSLLEHKVVAKSTCATILISKGQNHWSDSSSIFKKHEKSQLHKDTTFIMTSLKSRQSGASKGIDEIISTTYAKKVQQNRIFLNSILETIILCGRLCIPLRGHRDASTAILTTEVGEYSPYSVGNFIDLLNFRVKSGDTALANHLKSCGKNASYVSPQIQNDLIFCCGEFISDKIISEVKAGQFFSIICDEACDRSTKEQMSLVLRYVDSNLSIREDFIRFVHCDEGLSGLALSQTILKSLNELTLDVKNIRGQCYDGAGNVAGKINGCQSHILRVNRMALYTHCSSHRLNLVICNSCSVHHVRNMMDQIKQITYFFKFSETRLKVLRQNIEELSHSPSHAKIIDVCRTRWVERIIGMGVFHDMFQGILATFDEMAANVDNKINSDTVSKAISHRNAIERFEFIVAMVITRKVFDLTMDVTRLLQSRTNDMCKTMILIDSLKENFSDIRNNIDQYHNKWFEEAESLANKVSVSISVPRTTKRQTNRPNYSFSDVCDYYKKAISIPLLDHVNLQLKERFDHSFTPYYGLAIIPSRMLHLIKESSSNENPMLWKNEFKTFVNFYHGDFPNLSAVDDELDVWLRCWQKIEKRDPLVVPNSVEATLKAFPLTEGVFNNIQVALRIMATIPMTSCECERSFSAMKRLKNYSRSTMTEDRLNGLALMHIHLGIKIDKDKVINSFASRGPRRKDFV